MRASSIAVLLLLILTLEAGADPDEKRGRSITRADVAASFFRFERTYRDHPPTAEDRIAVTRAFGRVTRAFFRGGFSEVVRTLDGATAVLRPAEENSLARQFAESLRVVVEPPIVVAGSDVVPEARVYAIYEVPAPPEMAPVRILLTAPPRTAPPGPRDIEIPLPDGTSVVAGRWFVVSRSLDVMRAENVARLAALAPGTPALEDARAIARGRNALLRDRPDLARTINLVTDFACLASDLAAEIDELEEGRDPYAGRPGHLWRILTIGRRRVPARTYVPGAVKNGKPLPVVIALHGAGADENVFPEGYGAGRIVDLAEERGFVMVSPLTTGFLGSRRCLTALLEALEHHVPIDRTRVYVLGHSLGAMAAVAFSQSEADRLAAVCALAGGGRVRADRPMAPTLFIAGEIDPIIPAARVRATYDIAKAAGHPVEFRLAKGYGHTLLVGDHLPEAVDWLFTHRRKPAEVRAERR